MGTPLPLLRRRMESERAAEVEAGSRELSGRLDRHLVVFALALVLAVMVLRQVAGTAVRVLGEGSHEDEAASLAGDLVGAVAVVALLSSLGWWRRVGFNGPSHWRALELLAGPALLVAFVVVAGASDVDLSDPTRTALQLPQALLTGFWEEGLTRGFLLFALLIAALRTGRGPWPAVLGTAAAFGLLHFINLAGGADPAATVSQVLFAGLLAIGFAALLLRTNALWALVLLHALFDLPVVLQREGADPIGFQLAAVVLALIYALYGLFLLRRIKEEDLPAGPLRPDPPQVRQRGDAAEGRRILDGVSTATEPEALLEGLNDPQREAVLHSEGPLLILAGAGSGKTRVLTHRIARLVGTGQAQPGEILAITFTNKAANEMRERVGTLVGRRARAMWVMTFHSACARILRAEAERLGYTRGFTIYDEADSVRLVKRCIEELDTDPKRFPPRGIKRQISEAKNQLLDARGYRLKVDSFFEQTAADVYELYEPRLHAGNAMDFDDLLFRSVNLFELFPEVRERYRDSFRHVLVDEYQDTNRAQYRWLQLLAEEHRNLCVVGDDDQSIYRFRGADIRNILDFEGSFPDAHTVKLEQNYRSTQTILSAANAVIAHNRGRKPKTLWSELGQGDPVHVRELEDEHAEARFVVSEIERHVDAGGSRDEVAVFYRTNAQSRVLEDMLVRYGVGYQVIGGTRFYERAEVKDALAYLTLLVNPQDTVSFGRIVNSPRRGIGDTSQARILSHANTVGEPVFDVASAAASVPGLAAAAVKAVGRFMSTMERLRERAEGGAAVGDLLQETLEETGYLAALKAERTIESQGRLENLEELVGVAREYEATAEEPSVEEFLQQIALFSQQDDLRDEEGIVTLMTLHNAKGLEFGTVFMIGCEDGVFPHSRAVEAGDLEEERRLCYVGLTRARRVLYLTHARTRVLYGGRDFNLPSRFIAEIPTELTDSDEQLTGRVAATSWGSGAPAPGPGGGAPAAPAPTPGAAAAFAVGDDVEHANFGEGVVVGSEPGGTIVVRFAGDGSERKLMADYAPLKKIH